MTEDYMTSLRATSEMYNWETDPQSSAMSSDRHSTSGWVFFKNHLDRLRRKNGKHSNSSEQRRPLLDYDEDV